jgi:RNA polymerase sigma-70 factor (ECF subfamily)
MSNPQQSDLPLLLAPPEKWVDLYGDRLYRYALARVRDPEVAEDLVQDTFLAALKAKESFKGRSSVLSWMTGILKHKLIDHFKKHYKEQYVEHMDFENDPAEALFDKKGRWISGPAKWTTNPRHLIEQQEFLNIFFNCLQSLGRRLSRVFSLKEMDGHDSEEICKILDISKTNLWVLMYRARVKLRTCLEKNGTGINS